MVVGGGEDRGDAGATRTVRINFGRDPAGPAVPSSPGPLRQWEHGWRGPRTPSARLRSRTPPIGLSSVIPDAFICALQGSVSPSEVQRPTASPTHLCTEYGRYRALLTSARAECIIKLSRTCHVPCLTELSHIGATVHASTGVGNPVLPSVDEWRRHAFRHLYTPSCILVVLLQLQVFIPTPGETRHTV